MVRDMKKTFVLFAAALLGLTSLNAQEITKGSQLVLENIATRASERVFSDEPIKIDAVIEPLLRSAMAAPSAMNRQPWEFVVVTDRELLKQIAEQTKKDVVSRAQFAIIVCGNMKEAIEGEGREYWVQDCSAATENLLLAAHSMGLGAVWCGIYPIRERVEPLQKLLELPEYIIPLNIVPIGIVKEPAKPKDKWKKEKIHWDKYGRTDLKEEKAPREAIQLKESKVRTTIKKK